MTRYLIMSCEFISTVNFVFNMSCPNSHAYIFSLTLYDPGEGGGLTLPPPIFCPDAFNFGATFINL